MFPYPSDNHRIKYCRTETEIMWFGLKLLGFIRHTNLDHLWLSHVWATATLIQHNAAPLASMPLSWALMSRSPKSKRRAKEKANIMQNKLRTDRKNHMERGTQGTHRDWGDRHGTRRNENRWTNRGWGNQHRLKNRQQQGRGGWGGGTLGRRTLGTQVSGKWQQGKGQNYKIKQEVNKPITPNRDTLSFLCYQTSLFFLT